MLRRRILFCLLALTAMFVAVCSPSSRSRGGGGGGGGGPGQVLRDIGGALVDAGDALDDALVPVAEAETIKLACDREAVWEETADETGDTETYWDYYAEVRVPGLTPGSGRRITVWKCDLEWLNENVEPRPDCPNGYSCTGERPPRAECLPAEYGLVDERLVIECGSRRRAPDGGEMRTWGHRYREVHVAVSRP